MSVTADYTFNGDERSGKFLYNGVRRATQQQPAPQQQKRSAQQSAGDLVYGDYVCSVGRWDVSRRRMVYNKKVTSD
ncbi:MAG TPA: hypothetical protein VK993_15075 [Chthoniobacterales bacterium]|nr:hypothetical protein [Chthoniobacterales bacterium]